jgi:uncharacterized YceG family protein
VDDRPNLTVVSGEPPRPPEPPRPRHGRGHQLAALLGVLVGAAAIAVAVILVRGSSNGEAKPTSATTTHQASTANLPELRIVFPEGFTREEMADRIDAVNAIAKRKYDVEPRLSPKRYLAETRSSQLPGKLAGDGKRRSLEGFLFPATYTFDPRTTTEELVGMQLDAFDAAWAKVDLSYAKKKNLTPYDVLIIASMIEGEVRVPRERPLVAAVIYNRLEARMPLGIDATLRYGFHIPPTAAITQSQLESDNPYNTRKLPGLPPTPIGNPGLASMQAAAHPAKVPYLYFVRTKDCKSHYFSRTQAEQDAFLNGPNSFLHGPNRCA